LVRTDTGAGACEVLLVEEVDSAPHVYAGAAVDAIPATAATPRGATP